MNFEYKKERSCESPDTLKLMEGLIDIYMPDFKYAPEAAGRKYSDVSDYPSIAQDALREMYRQTGPLLVEHDVAQKGVMVRHLVMPHDLAVSREVIRIVAQTAPGCAINIMAQYCPAYRAGEFPELQDYPSSHLIYSLCEFAAQNGLRIL